jgi:hypothetical protein
VVSVSVLLCIYVPAVEWCIVIDPHEVSGIEFLDEIQVFLHSRQVAILFTGNNLKKKCLPSKVFFVEIPGANPTSVSYYATAVKIYNTTSNLVRFENIFFRLF